MARVKSVRPSAIIETEADIRAGMRSLRRRCPVMRRLHDIAGDPPLRRRPPGFDGLARIVVGQQLSVASAAAIWSRLAAAVSPLSAATLAAVPDDHLRACGLSRPKIRTLRALCAATTDRGVDIESMHGLTDQEVHAALTGISGIGPWTADIFIMFCLGRADAFAAGDLALQVAAQHGAGLPSRPSAAELTELAERWRPWRGVAARMLWAYYPHMKKVGSALPV